MKQSRDRTQQVITTKKRYGPDWYSQIAKLSKGGGFRDPEVARRAALRMHELRRQKKQKEEESHEPDTSTNSETS